MLLNVSLLYGGEVEVVKMRRGGGGWGGGGGVEKEVFYCVCSEWVLYQTI